MAAVGKGDDYVGSGEAPDEVAGAGFGYAVGTDGNLGNGEVVDGSGFENGLLGHPAHMGIERHLPLALSQNPLYYARYARRRRFSVDTEGIVGAEGNDSFFARMADRDEHSVEVRGTLSVVSQRPEAVAAEQLTDSLAVGAAAVSGAGRGNYINAVDCHLRALTAWIRSSRTASRAGASESGEVAVAAPSRKSAPLTTQSPRGEVASI